jgi:hypothetical protein
MHMLTAIALIFLLLWILGLLTSYTMGGFLHVFLIAAIVAASLRALRGENVFGIKGRV